MYNILTQHIHP